MKTILKNKQIKCLQTYQGSPDNNKKKKKFSFYGSKTFLMVMATCKMNNNNKRTKSKEKNKQFGECWGSCFVWLGVVCCSDLIIPCGSRSSLSGSHNLTSSSLALAFKVHPKLGQSLVSLHSSVMWSHRNISGINEGSSWASPC
jgi:hypothetical protein